MSVAAYLVLYIERASNAIVDAAIRSEPMPTCATTLRTEVLLEEHAESYEKACDKIRATAREALGGSLRKQDAKSALTLIKGGA